MATHGRTLNPDKKGWERQDASPQQIALYKKLRKKLGYSNEGLYFLKVKQGGPSKLEMSDKIDALLEEEKEKGLYKGGDKEVSETPTSEPTPEPVSEPVSEPELPEDDLFA